MDTQTVVSLIIVVLAAIGIVVYWYTHKPTEEQKKAAEEFLASLYDAIFRTVKKAIFKKVIDDKQTFYFDMELFKVDLIESVYTEVWEFVKDTVNNSDLPSLVKKMITRDNVEALVNTIVALPEVDRLIANQFNSEVAKAYTAMIPLEKAALVAAMNAESIDEETDKTEDMFKYNVEESDYPESVDINPDDDTVEEI